MSERERERISAKMNWANRLNCTDKLNVKWHHLESDSGRFVHVRTQFRVEIHL